MLGGVSPRLLVAGAALTVVLALGGGAAMGFVAARLAIPSGEPSAGLPAQPQSRASLLADGSVADLVEGLLPAVVTIEVPEPPTGANEPSRGAIGAGFFFTADGKVLTNAHVLPDSDSSVRVALGDGQRLAASIVGRDVWGDFAVLKVEGGPFPTLPLGDSDALRVGAPVLAIGSPFNLRNSVSLGIIGGKNRTLPKTVRTVEGPLSLPLRGLLQTDAVVNQGSSGGPLVDLRGNVVGINTASRGQGSGIGLALPISDVRARLAELERTGTVEYGFLGIRYRVIDPGLDQFADSPNPYGALIGGVIADSTARAAGIRDGDVLLAVNGQPLSRDLTLSNALLSLSVGDTVEFTVSRAGEELTLSAELLPRPKTLTSSS